MVTFAESPIRERRVFPAGSIVVRTAQRAGKVVMNLLEPKGPDSFVAWGYFDAVFEQKEYAESYVMEEEGAKLVARDTALAREYAARVAADSAFARSPGARLNWLYQHSPWRDQSQNVYPVGRITAPIEFPTERIK